MQLMERMQNMDELERVKDIMEQRGDDTGGSSGRRHIGELQEEIRDLKAALEEHADVLAGAVIDPEQLEDPVFAARRLIQAEPPVTG